MWRNREHARRWGYLTQIRSAASKRSVSLLLTTWYFERQISGYGRMKCIAQTSRSKKAIDPAGAAYLYHEIYKKKTHWRTLKESVANVYCWWFAVDGSMIRLHCIHWVWFTLTCLLWWIGTDKETLSFRVVGLMSVIACVWVWKSGRKERERESCEKCKEDRKEGEPVWWKAFIYGHLFLIGFPLLLYCCCCVNAWAFWSSNSLTNQQACVRNWFHHSHVEIRQLLVQINYQSDHSNLLIHS